MFWGSSRPSGAVLCEDADDVLIFGREAQHDRATTADEDRRMWPLDRAREHDRAASAVEATIEVDTLLGPEPFHEGDRLAQSGDALPRRPERQAEHSYSGAYHPIPIPKSSRPLDRTSIDAASEASISGYR